MIGFFRVFGFVAICVVLGSVAFWAVNRGQPVAREKPAATTEGAGESVTVITLNLFFQIAEGMNYDEVVKILGVEGALYNELGRAPDSDAPATKTIYTWANPDGSRMTLVFEKGKVVAKEQFDLE